jgi:hypothetical protein
MAGLSISMQRAHALDFAIGGDVVRCATRKPSVRR